MPDIVADQVLQRVSHIGFFLFCFFSFFLMNESVIPARYFFIVI